MKIEHDLDNSTMLRIGAFIVWPVIAIVISAICLAVFISVWPSVLLKSTWEKKPEETYGGGDDE